MIALTLTFDQAGLTPGIEDRARTDIVSTASEGGRALPITITIGGIPDGATADLELLDEPPGSNPLLTQVDEQTWRLDFDPGVWGPFRVRSRAVNSGRVVASVARRISIRSPSVGIAYPANAERIDPNATSDASVESVALTEMNEGGTNRPLVDFYRAVVEQLETAADGGVVDATARSAAAAAQSTATSAASTASTAASAASAAAATANAALPESLYGADSVVVGNGSGTPTRLSLPFLSVVARLASGDIVAATAAQLAAMLGISSGGSKSLSAVPSSPHPDDEEFDAATAAAWILRGTASDHVTVQTLSVTSGGVDPYAAQSANTAHIDYNSRRASWMQMQSQYTNDGGGSGYRLFCKKPSTPIGTNCFLWARIGDLTRPIGQDSDSLWGVALAQEVSSGPDPLNYVWCGISSTGTGSNRALFGQKYVAGSPTTLPSNVGSSESVGNPSFEFFAIHKRGTTIDFWAFNDAMDRIHLGSTTFSGTLAWQGFLVAGSENSDPGSTVHCADFLRRIDTASFPF